MDLFLSYLDFQSSVIDSDITNILLSHLSLGPIFRCFDVFLGVFISSVYVYCRLWMIVKDNSSVVVVNDNRVDCKYIHIFSYIISFLSSCSFLQNCLPSTIHNHQHQQNRDSTLEIRETCELNNQQFSIIRMYKLYTVHCTFYMYSVFCSFNNGQYNNGKRYKKTKLCSTSHQYQQQLELLHFHCPLYIPSLDAV